MDSVSFSLLKECAEALMKKFPEGNDPFRIVTRLLEEAGEVASEVAHVEGTGIKKEKYGVPDRSRLAAECMDCMGVLLQLVAYYSLEELACKGVEARAQRLRDAGWM